MFFIILILAIAEGSKELEHFNVNFMSALKGTQCYQDWLERSGGETNPAFEALAVGHPFAGTLSVADMKLRIAQLVSNKSLYKKSDLPDSYPYFF